MAPSDDDDAPRVPDPGSPDADRSSELPAGPRPRAIEPQRGDGVDPRPSGSVVFDVEVDDPSLVMPRPSRRARPKPTGDAPIEESEPGLAELPEATPDDEDVGADRNGDRHAGGGAADDGVGDDGGDDEVAEPPRQLVSGDPLLTGPMPAVRPTSRSSKSTTSRPDPAAAADEPDTTSSGETEAGEEPPSGDQPTTADSSTSTEDSGDARQDSSSSEDSGDGREDSSSGEQPARPPLTAKDLFSPITGEHAAVGPDIPPPPPPSSAATGSNAPPPPPAPPLTARQTPTGPTPTAPGPIVPAARRAARGSQVTGPIPTTTLPRDASGPIPAPRPTAVAPAPRLAGRRPRVRRVTRVVRHVDPWSVFKVSAVFSFVGYGIALVAGVLLWNVAYATGTVDNIERGLESTGWESFELNGGEIFHNAWIGGLFAAVGLTGLAVLTATLFNLITDLVGGVRMTVLEEEVVEKTASPMRRFSSRQAPEPGPPARSKRH